jgi:hypothetical protein
MMHLVNEYRLNELLKCPLRTYMPRRTKQNLDDFQCADQIATALHEAIHFLFAVKHRKGVLSAGISNSPKGTMFEYGGLSYGITKAMDFNEGLPVIESCVATAIFELRLSMATNLDPLPLENIEPLIESELASAVHACVSLQWPSPDFDEKAAIDVVDRVTAQMRDQNVLDRWWWLIRTVAIALLECRDKGLGWVSQEHTQIIYKFIAQYLQNEKVFPDKLGASMNQDLSWLSWDVNIQRRRNRETYEKEVALGIRG